MSIDPTLLTILVCPETKKPVRLASPEILTTLNAKINARTLRNRSGALLQFPLAAALVREDDQVLYPIVDDIPVMLIEESITLHND